MGGWGGVVLSGLVGAASGVGSAITQDALEQEKIKAQKERDAYLSQLRVNEHKQTTAIDIGNIGPTADAKSAAAARNLESDANVKRTMVEAETKGKLAEGFTLSKGQTRFDAQGNEIAHVEPDAKVLTPLEEDMIRARIQAMGEASADRRERTQILRDAAEAKAAGRNDKVSKADMANFKDVKGEGGVPTGIQIDDNTGIARKWVEGTPAQPGRSGVLGIGAKEAVPEKKGGFVYFDQNMNPMTPDAVNKQYPKLNRVEAGPEAAPPTAASAAPAPSIKGASGRPPGAGMASGKITTQRTIVARGTDKNTGQRVVKYSDGTIEPE